MITLLVPPDRFEQDSSDIEGDAYRHLFRARRMARGARLRLVDGRGRARWAEVREVDRRRATLILGAAAPANEPAYNLDLVVAALRGERAAWLVEKATEIGVRSIRFIATRRTPRKYGRASLERPEPGGQRAEWRLRPTAEQRTRFGSVGCCEIVPDPVR